MPTSTSTTRPAVIRAIDAMRSARCTPSIMDYAVRDFPATMDAGAPRIASYQADPDELERVLLLYSGGLDTSVMLRWIQERYGAEVVALTVDLGQPDEDWDVVVGKARDLGAVDAIVVDAREEFAHEYVVPAIRA